MHVIGGKFFAARMAGRDAFEARQQTFQFSLNLEHDRGAAARQQRRIARELDGVAQTLFGMQQDGLARERIFAEPERAAVAAARVGHAGALPAPFVLLEAAAQVAQPEQAQRLIEMGIGIVFLPRDRLAEAVDRVGVAVERLQRAAAIIPGLHMVGGRGEGAIEGGDGFVITAERGQRVAAIVQRGRVSRHQRQCGVEIGERRFAAAEHCERTAAAKQGVGVARIARQDLLEAGQRLLRAVEREQRVAAIEQGVRVARPQRQRLVEAAKRLGVTLERVQHIGEIEPGIGRFGIDLERGRHQPIGLAHLARLRFRQPEQMQRVEIFRRRFQHARVKLLRFAQLPLPVQGDRVLHGLRQVETGMLRHGARYGPGSSRRASTRAHDRARPDAGDVQT